MFTRPCSLLGSNQTDVFLLFNKNCNQNTLIYMGTSFCVYIRFLDPVSCLLQLAIFMFLSFTFLILSVLHLVFFSETENA